MPSPDTHRFGALTATLLMSTLALAACGGAGTQIVSTPPPVATPTPTPAGQTSSSYAIGPAMAPTPALAAGTYDTIGLDQRPEPAGARALAADDLRITVDPATHRYTLAFNPTAFSGLVAPGGQMAYTITDPAYGHVSTRTDFLNGVKTATSTIDGSYGAGNRDTPATNDPRKTLFSSFTGLSHVSMGDWSWGSITELDRGEVLFVYGDRTAPADLPMTGTAAYTGKDYIGGYYNEESVTINLSADFGARSIAANVDYIYYIPASSAVRTALAGSTQIRPTGDFEIALNGSKIPGAVTDHGFVPQGSSTAVVTGGAMSGALFGPGAAQIGGTLRLPDPNGGTLYYAFVAGKN